VTSGSKFAVVSKSYKSCEIELSCAMVVYLAQYGYERHGFNDVVTVIF
jgi:hypothetical protein